MYKKSWQFLLNNSVSILHWIIAVDGDIPDINFRENGYLYLSNDKGKELLERNNATQKSCGADWIDLLTPRELGDKSNQQYLLSSYGSSWRIAYLRLYLHSQWYATAISAQKFPWLNIEGIELGSFSRKNEGYFDPWSFVSALKRKVRRSSVLYYCVIYLIPLFELSWELHNLAVIWNDEGVSFLLDGFRCIKIVDQYVWQSITLSFISQQSVSLGVDYIDGNVVGARMMSESPSSVFVSSLHVQPPRRKTEEVPGKSGMLATSPPTFEITSGIYVNAAGEEIECCLFII